MPLMATIPAPEAQALVHSTTVADSGGLALALIAFMAFLLVGSAAASGSETALFGLTHGERLALRRNAPGRAEILDRLLSRPRRLLICVLLLNMIFNVLFFTAAALLLQTIQSPLLRLIAAFVPLIALILFGEILAKLLADAYRTQWSRVAAGPLQAISAAIGALLMAVDALVVAPLARLIAPAPVEIQARPSDVRSLLRAGADGGTIDEHEQALLEGVVNLNTLRARTAMTPRVDLVPVAENIALNHLAAAAQHAGTFRLPVMDERGLVIKTIIDARASVASEKLIFEQPIYVPENARLDRVLGQLRDHQSRTAVCVDEHGESTGMLEISDILRALVGLPYEQGPNDEEGILMVGLGCWSVPGRTPVDDLARLFALHRDDDFRWPAEAVTIAGAVMAHLGRLASNGDKARFGPLEVEVEHVEGRSIERVLVRTIEPDRPVWSDQP